MKALRACLLLVGMPILLILVLLLLASPAVASEPGMDYWFTETFTLGDIILPDGISLRASSPASGPRGSLSLENQTDTLLFVLSLNYKDRLVMVTPDPDWETRLKLAHEVASYLVAPAKPAYLAMDALADLDHALVDSNVLSDYPPPTDVELPASQSSELLLVYGEQVLVVPFTVSYALNSKFSSAIAAASPPVVDAQPTVTTQSTPSGTATAPLNLKYFIVLGLAGVLALLIVIWLLGRVHPNRGSG